MGNPWSKRSGKIPEMTEERLLRLQMRISAMAGGIAHSGTAQDFRTMALCQRDNSVGTAIVYSCNRTPEDTPLS